MYGTGISIYCKVQISTLWYVAQVRLHIARESIQDTWVGNLGPLYLQVLANVVNTQSIHSKKYGGKPQSVSSGRGGGKS